MFGLADVLCGAVTLPHPKVMHDEIARHRQRLAKRYVGSARYTLEVDFREYAAQLRRAMRRGRAGG